MLLQIVAALLCASASVKALEIYSNVANVLNQLGYSVGEHQVITRDGYWIGITHARCGLARQAADAAVGTRVDHKQAALHTRPLVFFHGLFHDPTIYVSNIDKNATCNQDLAAIAAESLNLSPQQVTEREQVRKLAKLSVAKSLPTLAMSLGYDVWFVHKRGTPRSSKRSSRRALRALLRRAKTTGLSSALKASAARDGSLDRDWGDALEAAASGSAAASSPAPPGTPNTIDTLLSALTTPDTPTDAAFWNFTLDEQAAFDVPAALDYVLKKSHKQQVSLVSHSSGGATVLMALLLHKNLLDKIEKAIFWSPTLHLGHGDNVISLSPLVSALALSNYVGPFPPSSLVEPLQHFTRTFCDPLVAERIICTVVLNSLLSLGPDFSRNDGTILESRTLQPVSSLELRHLYQFFSKHYPRMYDFGTKRANMLAYGQIEPPKYNVSNIEASDTETRKISLWSGRSDRLGSPRDVASIARGLRVPYEYHLITRPGVFFDHRGYFLHEAAPELAIVPAMRELARASAASVRAQHF